ncbi:hypothetical protein BOW53_05845 [Solemya pervernicosa gill symbiont]|uniref:Uncharacterized protein n=2 Tax=Gammaproteobacteria incertae sedis TaxID=118884 RepID=A0A1T2L7F6_9GAMM|nr:hypothetical protein [Candidatus Reidiella endopervernicosa]OOZ41037.1 hypothetical protein BOW53_05845 [Solemya pervernicosa gill symbiont]QKQ25100.1 hypothetical protein HUE57_01475 [Candidatus Reidiella endopervernicosa]
MEIRRKLLTFLITPLALVLLLPLQAQAQAGDSLSGDEIKTLFTDKTFDGVNHNSGSCFKNYASPKGACLVHYLSGKKSGETVEIAWKVKGDMHCCVKKGKNICGTITNEGNGVYHKILENGVHLQTYSNVNEGNQL